MLQVFVFRDGALVGSAVFDQPRVAVGRDADEADLPLDSPSISRVHVVLEPEGRRVRFRDAGSTNGTLLNGRAVREGHLGPLDELTLGELTLKVNVLGRSSAGASKRAEPTTVIGPAPSPPAAVPPSAAAPPPAAPAKSKGLSGLRPSFLRTSRFRKEAAPVVKDGEAGSAASADPTKLDALLAAVSPAAAHAPSPGGAPTLPDASGAPTGSPMHHPGAPPEARALPAAAGPRAPGAAGARAPAEMAAADEPFTPPFSLVEALVRERRLRDGGGGIPCVEVLAFSGERLHAAELVRPGHTLKIGPKLGWWRRRRTPELPRRRRLLRVRRDGRCTVELPPDGTGTVERDGEKLPVAALASAAESTGVQRYVLGGDDVLTIAAGTRTYQLRFVHAPVLPRAPWSWRHLLPERLMQRSLGGSAATHVVLLVLVGLLTPAATMPGSASSDAFIEVSLETAPRQLVLEEQPPAPAPAEPAPAAPSPPVAPKQAKRATKRIKAGGTSAGPPGVLGLLAKRGSSAAPGPAAAVAAATNIATAPAGGQAAGYRIAGLQSKLPTSDLRVGGGGGGLATRGAAALLRGGGGGGGSGVGQLAGKSERGVSGLVQKGPQAMRSQGEGSLDRAQIQRVINENIGAIQRCYERELLKTSGLAGRVQVEWTITASGGVRTVRQKFSDLGSTAVVTCIMGVIGSWRFPQPKGGEVVVTYPFSFKPIGF